MPVQSTCAYGKPCQAVSARCILVLDIQADGFLHHMVRNIMGVLFAIGKDELGADEITRLIAAKDRTLAPPTASANGLYFINAYYPKRFQELLPNMPSTPLWLGLWINKMVNLSDWVLTIKPNKDNKRAIPCHLMNEHQILTTKTLCNCCRLPAFADINPRLNQKPSF